MMLKIRNLEAGYGQLRVLKNLSLHISAGEVVTIIGANGAGKTTLLKTIVGLIQAHSGEILFNDTILGKTGTEKIAAMGCVLVPEGRQLFAPLTVEENLRLGGYLYWKKDRKKESEETIAEIFHMFPVIGARRSQLAGTLSGGEQQMLAIGRALMTRPKLLMMDEPSMGIAPIIVKEIFRTITMLSEKGMTILLVEQNARAALRVAQRGYVIETGQIVLEGSSEELLNNRDVQRAYLGKEYKSINE
ncbi:MAG: ABC transporter ATP-binding protein [Spirochaetales bacterium]|nr:ABC transporter ATP-binding protein [Spirochaetales bacterium]